VLTLHSLVGLVVVIPYIIKLLCADVRKFRHGTCWCAVCRTNSYRPINCKGHAFVLMCLCRTKEFVHFSCICSYQFSHVYIFFPVQRHEDSEKLAYVLCTQLLYVTKNSCGQIVELVTGKE